MADTEPTWIYAADGGAKVVDLARDASAPDGWSRDPGVITDPAKRTADALSGVAAPVVDEWVPANADRAEAYESEKTQYEAELATAKSEIDRLKSVIDKGMAENADLLRAIEDAEAEVEKAATDLAALRDALAAAETDKTAALASVDGLTAELASAKADLDAATAPKAPAKGK